MEVQFEESGICPERQLIAVELRIVPGVALQESKCLGHWLETENTGARKEAAEFKCNATDVRPYVENRTYAELLEVVLEISAYVLPSGKIPTEPRIHSKTPALVPMISENSSWPRT